MEKDTVTNQTSPKTNFHTHTTFCDGHSSAEDMVKAAIKKDINILGFSSHSMFPFSSQWHMPAQMHAAYCAEIRRLAESYKNSIAIKLGFESDFIPGFCSPRFDAYAEFKPDYLIGSVHFLYTGKGFFEADDSPEN